eukprot:6186605-Pleurochrysis_carterae.AAC.2
MPFFVLRSVRTPLWNSKNLLCVFTSNIIYVPSRRRLNSGSDRSQASVAAVRHTVKTLAYIAEGPNQHRRRPQ